MTSKVGRNDPCLCGSGKKYKKCCEVANATPVETERKGHDGAVARALEWLMTKHRKAASVAIEAMILSDLNNEEQEALEALEAQDEQAWKNIHLNATEWLLAEGHMLVKGEQKRVSEHVLGKGGPLFTVDQRRWMEQLAERHLRLYEITDVMPGEQITMCDALDIEALPIVVCEKTGSDASIVGSHMGFRLMEVNGHYELSGVAYQFSRFVVPGVIAEMREAIDQFDKCQEVLPGLLSVIIRTKWLEQYFTPMEMPTMMDTYTGEPMLLITDHYRVQDWGALTQSLSSQHDVEGDRKVGWSRFLDCEDGETRATVTINIEKRADSVTLFYKTQSYADNGRPWFEAIVNDAVQFVSRELSDPKGMMANMSPNEEAESGNPESDVPPEMLADLIEKTITRMYANWADEPIQALNGKTPRQAIKTPTGLERVKGLLRSYQTGEKQQAEQQGRREISYEFLWRELNISS